MIHIGPDFPRVNAQLIEDYRKVGTATLGHVLEEEICDPAIRPIYKNVKLVGTAFTVQTKGKDIAAITEAYKLAQPGDVLVVNCEDYKGIPYACAGEMSTYKSIRLGIAGLVVDGGITDYLEMEKIEFPCFSRHITALVGRVEGRDGAVRVPVSIGDVTVRPGDLVLADDNGVLFLSPEKAQQMLPSMLEKEAKEEILREDFIAKSKESV